MSNLPVVSFFVYAALDMYVFRFQRTTLSLSREHLGVGNTNYQMLPTPNWVGTLGWIKTGLFVINIALFFIHYGLAGAAFVALYGFVLGAIIDVFTPFPSYAHCFKVIENHLEKEEEKARRVGDEEMLQAARSLMEQVKYTRQKYKINDEP